LGVLLLHWSKPSERRVLRGQFLEDAFDCAGILIRELEILALSQDLKDRALKRDELLVEVFGDLLDVAPPGLFGDDTQPKDIPLPVIGKVFQPSLQEASKAEG
jgi:hypothetical protein